MKKYEKYKDSGIEWIGEIPEHWEIKKVKHNFSFKTGFTPPTGKREYYENGKYIWINISDLNTKYISDSENKLTDKAIADYKPEIVPKGSLLYSFKLSVGKVAFNTVDAYTNEAIFSIERKDSTNLNFFYYSLPKQIIKNANENIYGAKILNQELIKNAKLIIPPPEEQTAIANYLDRKTAQIDELISNKKRLLELYEEEKTAIINQAVTKGINPDVKMKDSGIEWLGEIPEHWEVKRFKYYFELITEKGSLELPKIGLENIESKTGKFIETDTNFEGQGISFKTYDILFGKLRPYLAKVWLSDFEGQAVGDFYVFRSKKEVIPKFAKYRILDSSFIEVTNSSTYGSKMPRVSWEFIANLPIAFPPLEEQTAIVDYIEKEVNRINAKVEKTKKLIELLEEYKQALISEVVTGKVKVI
jgi:restriction endonuclease S subunit